MITQDLSVASKHSRVFGAGTSTPSLHSARTYLDRESLSSSPAVPDHDGPPAQLSRICECIVIVPADSVS